MTGPPLRTVPPQGLAPRVHDVFARTRRCETGPSPPARGDRSALPRHALVAALVLVAQFAPSAAWAALTVTAVAEGERTDSGFKGTAPANAKVTFLVENNPTVGGVTTYMTTADAKGNYEFKIPKGDFGSLKDKGNVTVTSPGCPNSTTTLAAVFTPGVNAVATASTVNPGSTATAGGMTFALSGGFTALDTNVDYNPASPTFGKLSSVLLASRFQLTGTGIGGTLGLTLNADQPFTVSLLPAWQSPTLSGNTIAFSNLPFSGTATFNSTVSPFTGTAGGTVTFLDGGVEDTIFNFSASTDFGTVAGSVAAQGTSEIAPEPSSAVLLLTGATALAALALRRRPIVA
jgi:hypothetical protein